MAPWRGEGNIPWEIWWIYAAKVLVNEGERMPQPYIPQTGLVRNRYGDAERQQDEYDTDDEDAGENEG